MIALKMLAPGFGIQKTEIGGDMMFQDHDSGILMEIPCDSNSMATLIGQMAACLTEEQKRKLAPLFTSGIVLPGPSALGQFPDGPPR